MKASIGIAVVSVVATISQASATSLPLPAYVISGSLDIAANGPTNTFPFSITNQQSLDAAPGTVPGSQTAPGSSVSGSVTVTTGPVSGISITATATASSENTGATAVANNPTAANQGDTPGPTLSYSLEVVGAPGTTTLGVQASGGVSYSSADPYQFDTVLTALLSISNNNVLQYYEEAGVCGGCSLPSSFSGNTYQVSADTVYTVSLATYLVVEIFGNSGGGTETVSAFVDPQYFAAPGYTIELSPGIGNGAATPLPAALPLFATALGAMGLLGWRRKRRNATD